MTLDCASRGLRASPPALALFLIFVGCSSAPDLRSQFAQEIETADALIQDGELLAAGEAVEKLLYEIENHPDPRTAPQRMICDALLVEIHASATKDNGFLKQPGAFEFNPMDSSAVGEVNSTTAHRLAALYHGWHLTAQAQDAAAWAAQDGDVLIVPSHASRYLDTGYASRFVALVYASSLAELGFDDQAKDALRKFKHPDFGAVFNAAAQEATKFSAKDRPEDDVLAILDEYELPDHLRWQILTTAHDIYRERFDETKQTSNPTMAFRLGCLAALGELKQEGDYLVHNGTVQDPRWRDDFYGWVVGLKKRGTFRSGQDEIRQGVTESTDSGDPAIRFIWSPTPEPITLGGSR